MKYVLHFSGNYYCVGNFAVKKGFNDVPKKVWDIASKNLLIQGMITDGRITFKKGHEPEEFKPENYVQPELQPEENVEVKLEFEEDVKVMDEETSADSKKKKKAS